MTETVLQGLIAAGLGGFAGALAWAAVPLVGYPSVREWKPDDRIALCAGTAAAVLVTILAWGWNYALAAGLVAGLSAVAVTRLVFRWVNENRGLARHREILLLFDAVELYMRAGLSMYHALDAARILTPSIRTEIGQALTYWPQGSARALELLRRRLNTPEADILVSLLLQLEQAGIEHFADIVRREGRRLEQLKDAADRARVSKRPFLLMLYRMLPLLACLGMIAGAFFMHAMGVLKATGIF